jgi:hypothetical protein
MYLIPIKALDQTQVSYPGWPHFPCDITSEKLNIHAIPFGGTPAWFLLDFAPHPFSLCRFGSVAFAVMNYNYI